MVHNLSMPPPDPLTGFPDEARECASTDPPGVADLVRPGLAVLFCGINPGALSGRLGQHFARPGNRFWKVIHQAGFTDHLLVPAQQEQLLDYGVGITNLVERTSRAASDLDRAELRAGAAGLERRAHQWSPRFVAVLGVSAYRVAFGRPKAAIGPQPEPLGPDSRLWVLPNPSGLQARYQLGEMVEMYSELRRAAYPGRRSSGSFAP